jgi:hypothetical protein
MNEASSGYQSWGNARLAQLQACRAEVATLEAQLEAMRVSFNTANTELRTVGESLQVEIAEFNAREGEPENGANNNTRRSNNNNRNTGAGVPRNN